MKTLSAMLATAAFGASLLAPVSFASAAPVAGDGPRGGIQPLSCRSTHIGDAKYRVVKTRVERTKYKVKRSMVGRGGLVDTHKYVRENKHRAFEASVGADVTWRGEATVVAMIIAPRCGTEAPVVYRVRGSIKLKQTLSVSSTGYGSTAKRALRSARTKNVAVTKKRFRARLVRKAEKAATDKLIQAIAGDEAVWMPAP